MDNIVLIGQASILTQGPQGPNLEWGQRPRKY